MPHDAARRPSKAAKLADFSIKDQKVIVRYLYQQEVDSSEIHKLLTAACGEAAPSYKEVREWIKNLVEGREEPDMCVCSGGRKMSGMPADATDPALVTRLEYLINNDYRISLERLSELSNASVQTIQGVITGLLGLKKVSERWVPRLWTPEQRAYRVAICQQLLDLYNAEGSSFLTRLIVGDDSYVLYHKNPTPGTGGKYKPADESVKVYCHFYYDKQGVILADTHPGSEPLSSEEYIALMRDSLIPSIKRRRNNFEGPFLLLQNITPAHNNLETLNALRELNITVLPHAPASPDLEPFEYWLFKHMKKTLDALTFQSRTDMWSAVKGQLHAITDLDFNKSITKLPERWNICMEKQGLYLL